MDDSEQFKKLFIGGLHLQTSDQSLKSFYEKWGEVVDCIVMKDPTTKRSRGFGFITYSEANMVDDCLAERPHVIDGKQVDPKRAMPRDSNKPELHLSIKKVFVGGIKEPITEDDLREYFSKYGMVESIDMVSDKDTGKKRGFCFMTFDDTDSVDKIVLIRNHKIRDVTVEVKKAVERDGKGGIVGALRGRGGRGGFMPMPFPPGRGGYGPMGRGAVGAYGAAGYAGAYGDYSYGGYNGGVGGWGGAGAGGGAAGGWNPQAMNTPNPYGNGYGPGYSAGYGGGAMKSNGYTQRAAGPYGGGYGGGGGAGGMMAYGGVQATPVAPSNPSGYQSKR